MPRGPRLFPFFPLLLVFNATAGCSQLTVIQFPIYLATRQYSMTPSQSLHDNISKLQCHLFLSIQCPHAHTQIRQQAHVTRNRRRNVEQTPLRVLTSPF